MTASEIAADMRAFTYIDGVTVKARQDDLAHAVRQGDVIDKNRFVHFSLHGAGVITASQLAEYLGVKTAWRVREKYLRDDEDSAVPVIRAVGGKKYIIKEVAVRIKESMY